MHKNMQPNLLLSISQTSSWDYQYSSLNPFSPLEQIGGYCKSVFDRKPERLSDEGDRGNDLNLKMVRK